MALPSALFADSSGKAVRVEVITPTPLVRIYKSNIILTCIPKALYILHYLKGVFDELPTLPGYFSEEKVESILNLTGLLSDVFEDSDEEIPLRSSRSRGRRVIEEDLEEGPSFSEEDMEDTVFYSPPQQTSRWRH